MNRRYFLGVIMAVAVLPIVILKHSEAAIKNPGTIRKIIKTDDEWRDELTREQYQVLRRDDTERAFSSHLNDEKRLGIYVCAGCDLPLFAAEMKFDSGTGWPSFFTAIPAAVETRLDFRSVFPRREYHCARCGGHQGHVFKDGPQPSGERWCNNGVALNFIPA